MPYIILAEPWVGNRLHACTPTVFEGRGRWWGTNEPAGGRGRGWGGGGLLVSSGNVIDAPLGIVLVSFIADVVIHCGHHLHMPHHTLTHNAYVQLQPCTLALHLSRCKGEGGDSAGSRQVMQDFDGCKCLCRSHSNFRKLAVLHVASMVPLALRS